MLARTVTLDARDGEPWRIYPISDAHIGDVCCDEAGLQAYIDTIRRDEHGRCVITGDLVSAIGKGDKRLDLSSLAEWVLDARPRVQQDILGVQAVRAVEWLRPIADRIDGLVAGNHETKPRSWYGRDVMAEIAKELGISPAYLGSQGWLTYSLTLTTTQRRLLTLYLHHGTSSGRKVGGQAAQLEEMLLDHDCDIAICGHSHRTFAHPVPQVRRDGKTGKLLPRHRWGILAGTWQRTPDAGDLWQDERRLRPAHLGGVVIEYNPATAATTITL
jgi:UDP-2,3-diacylglucosamine pyrophosphatase LpxH